MQAVIREGLRDPQGYGASRHQGGKGRIKGFKNVFRAAEGLSVEKCVMKAAESENEIK